MDEKILQSIRKYALKNAFDYKTANASKVIGKILGEYPEQRQNTKELMILIQTEIVRINSLTEEQIKTEMSEFEYEEKKIEEEKGISLPDAVEGNVITRFPPEPGGNLHIGHAKAAFLNYEGACAHGGYMRLRMDDTNPQKARSEFVETITESLKWLGIKWRGEITYSSDYMEKFYAFAQELIMKAKAYVCTCPQEQISEGREKKFRCDCAARMPEENISEFTKMVDGDYLAGEAILRYKGDMKAQNTVMRDPTLFRIIEGEHYRKGGKYKCWPNYDFAAPILDSLESVTHAMRSKEYELRDELYFVILDDLELRKPKLISFSRLAIAGAPISKRLIAPLIEEGKVSGFDDIRLPTLMALRRRGIRPDAIREFVLSFGLSKVESEPGWDKLLAINRKMIDSESQRRFFVAGPAKVEISKVNENTIKLANHPQNKELGTREVAASSPIYIPSADAQNIIVGETFRLKDWCNVRVNEKNEVDAIMPDGKSSKISVLKCEFVSMEGNVEKKVQWVADESKVAVRVDVPHDLFVDGKFNENSLETVWGWGERSLSQESIGEIFQFERFGFVRLDTRGENPNFVFISK